MSDSAFEIISRRRKAVCKIYRIDPLSVPVMVNDPVGQLPSYGGGSVSELAGGTSGALVWQRSFDGVDTKDATSLWVRTDDTAYARNYETFLSQLYGIQDFHCLRRTADESIRHQVDHVYASVLLTSAYDEKKSSNEVSEENMRYHLVEAVPASANASGGAFERKYATSPLLSKQRSQRQMNMMQVLKLYGFKSPRGKDDANRYEEITKTLVSDGWYEWDVQMSLDSMIENADHDGGSS